MNLNLRKFDIRSITPDKVCVFIGKRETGKSFLVKDLLWHHRAVPIGTVISGIMYKEPPIIEITQIKMKINGKSIKAKIVAELVKSL